MAGCLRGVVFFGNYPSGVHFLFTSKVANPYPFNQARSNYKLLGGGFKKNVYVMFTPKWGRFPF